LGGGLPGNGVGTKVTWYISGGVESVVWMETRAYWSVTVVSGVNVVEDFGGAFWMDHS
jgi:hypothetical protein